MDLNAKIKWANGMPLSPEALSSIEDGLNQRRTALIRSSFVGAWGVIPGCQARCSAMFVDGKIEVKVEDCIALLPSGRIMDMNEEASFPVSRLEEGFWYLCAGFGEGDVEFEKEGVPYVRPTYELGISRIEDLGDRLPLLRLKVGGGNVGIDKEFIIPALSLLSDKRYCEWMQKIADVIAKIADHPNLEPGDKKRTMLQYRFLSGSYTIENSINKYILFLREVCQAVQYYVMGEKAAPDNYYVMDPQLFMASCLDYLNQAVVVLDGTVLVDNSIDYEALKEELRKEIYGKVSEEMQQDLQARIEELSTTLGTKLEETLRDYIEHNFKEALETALREELTEKLRTELYDKLYQALYQALYVPEKEEEIYTPII